MYTHFMKHKLLFLVFGVIILVGFLHFAATILYFYWTINWFDILMHFLGGLSIGLLAIWIAFASGIYKKAAPRLSEALLSSLLVVIVVGVGWEIFENLNGLTQSTESYPLDIIHDLIADVVGSIVAGFIGAKNKLYE